MSTRPKKKNEYREELEKRFLDIQNYKAMGMC